MLAVNHPRREIIVLFFLIIAQRGGPSVFGECGPTTTEIRLQPECFEVGETVFATIDLRDADHLIIAGQFFAAYNPAVLSVVSVEHGDDPFILMLFVDTSVPGLVDCSVAVVPPSMGTSSDTTMATIEFLVVGDGGDPFVRFRLHDPPTPTQLLTIQGGLVPILRTPSTLAPDLLDLADFQQCFSGGDNSALAECRCQFDADGDNDVDETDYHVFRLSLQDPAGGSCE